MKDVIGLQKTVGDFTRIAHGVFTYRGGAVPYSFAINEPMSLKLIDALWMEIEKLRTTKEVNE